jgi:hypothetical protein
MENRRDFLGDGAHACLTTMAAAALGTAVAGSASAKAEEKATPQRFLLVGLCGSENPTRANFPFVWASALREAGNEVRIELAGDATVMMRTSVANSVTGVGWPPFSQALAKVVDLKIPIYV